jgi:large subunit ribosomal protein L35
MPKLKTNKSLTKRFKITKTGKIFRRATGLDHSRAKKTGKKVRDSRKFILVSKAETKNIKRMLRI